MLKIAINALNPYHKSLIGVDNVEETTEQVPGDVEKGEDDDVPDLHEPRAVEAVPLVNHDEEVEAGKEGSEEEKDNGDWAKTDIEQVVEEGTEIYLGNTQTLPEAQRTQGIEFIT